MRLRAEGTGPPVVKVAGLAAGVGLYHEEVAAATAAGFRIGSLDTSGDRLDDPARGALTWDGFVAEVCQALDELGERKAILWGTSFGSLICLATAARRPDRVAGLLLCSPPLPGWKPRLHVALLGWASRRPRAARATAHWFTAGFLLLNAWEFVKPSALIRLPGLARAARDARTPNRTIHQKLELLLRDHPGLPSGEIPCSIIAGRWDTVTFPGASRRLAAMLPGSRVRLLGWAGHSCAYSRPRTYARWVIEELRRLSNDSSPDNQKRSQSSD